MPLELRTNLTEKELRKLPQDAKIPREFLADENKQKEKDQSLSGSTPVENFP